MIHQFRKIRKTDFKVVSELIKSFYEEIPSEKTIDFEKMRRTFDELLSFPEKGTIYVIETQNKIIGYMILINYWCNEYGGNLIFIDEIYINPKYRNKGIGSDVIKTLTNQSINSSKAIQLEVVSSNLNAQKFYEKNGFKYLKNKLMILEF